jgi:hypothetical protein
VGWNTLTKKRGMRKSEVIFSAEVAFSHEVAFSDGVTFNDGNSGYPSAGIASGCACLKAIISRAHEEAGSASGNNGSAWNWP